MHQYTLEEYLATPERALTYDELKARLEFYEMRNRTLALRLKELAERLDAEYHRGFDAADKATYVLGYYDGKNDCPLNFSDIPARIRRHRLFMTRDAKARQALIDRYERRGLKY